MAYRMDYEFFMSKALTEARQALAMGEFPVGCVIAYGDRVLVTGSRLNSAPDQYNELDHAEMAALRRLVEMENKIDREGVTVFCTLEPCLMCYAAMLVNGLRRIVYAYEDMMGGATGLDLKGLGPFYAKMEIEVTPHVMREESLGLLKDFFSNPRNSYLRETPLARYTLGQQVR